MIEAFEAAQHSYPWIFLSGFVSFVCWVLPNRNLRRYSVNVCFSVAVVVFIAFECWDAFLLAKHSDASIQRFYNQFEELVVLESIYWDAFLRKIAMLPIAIVWARFYLWESRN